MSVAWQKGQIFLFAARPVDIFFVASKADRLAKAAVEALELPGMNFQIVSLEVVVFALKRALLALLGASSAGGFWRARHSSFNPLRKPVD